MQRRRNLGVDWSGYAEDVVYNKDYSLAVNYFTAHLALQDELGFQQATV